VANDLIADVEAEVLSYVEVRRTPPTANESRVLAAVCFRRFVYRATADRRSATEDQQKDFDRDTKWLEDYAEGKRHLGDDAEVAAPPDPQFNADSRVFTRDKLKGW